MTNRTSLIPRRIDETLRLLMETDDWIMEIGGDWGNVSANNGSTSVSQRLLMVLSSVTANGQAAIHSGAGLGWSIGKDFNTLDWSKKIILDMLFESRQNTSSGVSRFTFGKHVDDIPGALSDKGIGIRIDDLAVNGVAHNGSDLIVTDLSTTLVDNIVTRITIKSNGLGAVEWLINGAPVGAITTGGPIGDSTSVHNRLVLEVDNGGDTDNQQLAGHSLKVYVQQ